MQTGYRARWISRQRIPALGKSGELGRGLLLDTFKGFIVVEPPDIMLGDGAVLSAQEADIELQTAFCLETRAKLTKARRLLGLDGHASQRAGAV